ncbi:hypothetical protein J3E69DRAFT_226831 [Trichoderma sp. SZMC 28015]
MTPCWTRPAPVLHRSIGNPDEAEQWQWQHYTEYGQSIDLTSGQHRGHSIASNCRKPISTMSGSLASGVTVELRARHGSEQHQLDRCSSTCQRSRQRHANYKSDGLVTVSWERRWKNWWLQCRAMELVPMVMQWCLPNLEAEIQAPHMYQTNTEYSYASLVDDATRSEDGKSSTWSKAVCRALFSNLARVLRTQLHMLGLVGEPP